MHLSPRLISIPLLLTILAAPHLIADTYDVKTLVELETANEAQIELLYALNTEIVGRIRPAGDSATLVTVNG